MKHVRSLWLLFLLLTGTGTAWSADLGPKSLQHDSARCKAGSVDACYDAIRWSPHDASLLVDLGDDLARAGKPADAIRSYRRAASIAPNLPGLGAKIKAVEIKMAAKPAPRSAPSSVSNNKPPPKRYSNAAPDSESH